MIRNESIFLVRKIQIALIVGRLAAVQSKMKCQYNCINQIKELQLRSISELLLLSPPPPSREILNENLIHNSKNCVRFRRAANNNKYSTQPHIEIMVVERQFVCWDARKMNLIAFYCVSGCVWMRLCVLF